MVMQCKPVFLSMFLVLLLGAPGWAQNVIEDQGVGMTAEELEFIVKYWTPQMQEVAAVDLGDRYELLNMALANKKIALEAAKIDRETDPELYWQNQLLIRNMERQFVVNTFMAKLEIPDMSELARERYTTNPDKYALVPEARLTSHILFRCRPRECDRKARKAEAQQVLDRLAAGESFETLAAQYSEDPGSKDKGGKFDKWLQRGTPKVDPYYLQAVFDIEETGQHTALVDSNFGIHIIRLDEIRPQHYRPYDEVKDAIIAELEQEYKELAAKEFDARFRLSDETYIDPEAMERIFSKYKPADTPAGE